MKFIVGSLCFSLLSCAVVAQTGNSCIQCDSGNDVKCAINPDTIFSKSCSKPGTSKCFVRIVDGRTVRGCVSDLEDAIANNCGAQMNCMSCEHSEECNNQPFPQHRLRCMQCKGDLNSTCATSSFSVSESSCPLYKERDTCIVRKSTKKNEFIRGCLSSYTEECKNNMCLECQGNGCNMNTIDDPKIPDSASSVVGSIVLTFLVSAFLAYFN